MRTEPLVRTGPKPLIPWLAGAIVAVLVSSCAGPAGTGTSAPGTTPPPPSPTAATEVVGVYFLTDTGTDLRLAREFREVSGDVLTAAVETMIAGPVDPDYATTWNPATEVLAVQETAEEITVDLSQDARTANVGSPGAALMIQQLVYTVTAAAGSNVPVVLLIEGKTAGELWGAVEWDEPIGRADPLEVRLLVQINSPSEGALLNSPVTVSGEAAVFEAVLPWRVLTQDGALVTEGTTMTEEGMTFAPFTFNLELEPGTYVVEIREDDPSEGEGGPVQTDTRTITVS